MKRYRVDFGYGRYYFEPNAQGEWVRFEDHEEIIQRQASAALAGMNAAKAISSNDLERAARLRAESSPDALESERQANAKLTQELSLAEEGLANYAQEVKGAQHDIEQLMAAARAEANEVERLRALLREVYNHGENGDLHKKIGAVFGVEPGEDIPAVPQEAKHE